MVKKPGTYDLVKKEVPQGGLFSVGGLYHKMKKRQERLKKIQEKFHCKLNLQSKVLAEKKIGDRKSINRSLSNSNSHSKSMPPHQRTSLILIKNNGCTLSSANISGA